jgi:hypothetical protein
MEDTMTSHLEPEVQLSFDPWALERCYLVADILNCDFDAPFMEYALLGLSTESNPFHVVATPLLPGQRVTSATVEQPGRQVLRMRREIETLSKRVRQQLLPITFIHRHPGGCDASRIDDAFLRGVFIDQVATVISFEDVRAVEATEHHRDCPELQRHLRESSIDGRGRAAMRSEYGIAFSLIVNRKRGHRLYGVRKSTCASCGRDAVRYIPAQLAEDSHCWISPLDRALLRRRLEEEIRAKISFKRGSDTAEAIQ